MQACRKLTVRRELPQKRRCILDDVHRIVCAARLQVMRSEEGYILD